MGLIASLFTGFPHIDMVSEFIASDGDR